MKFDVADSIPRSVPFREARRDAPADWQSARVYLIVPLSAGIVSLFAWLLIVWGAGWSARLALIIAGVVMFLVLLSLTVMLWCKPLLWSTERIVGLAPTPEYTPPPEMRIQVTNPDARRIQYLDLPLRDPQLARDFAARLLAGYPLSESQWTGRGAPFSKRQFRAIRDRMVALGMAAWRNADAPAQGLELTAYGRSVIRQLAGPDFRPAAALPVRFPDNADDETDR